MNKLFCAMLALFCLVSCKTTEANYQAAYEAAAAKREAASDAEEDFITRPDRNVIVSAFMSAVKTADNDTLTPEKPARYSVAVNKFKQVFNAKALCNRLRDNGWKHAYVARTADDEFYVMIAGYDEQDNAVTERRRIETDKNIPFGRGYPVVIRSAWK